MPHSSGSAAYAVPTDRQRISAHLDKGKVLTGDIFLESFTQDLSIHQRVTAFLENSNLFFPLKTVEAGKTAFINKYTVGLIEVGISEDPSSEYFSFHLMHSIPVTVELRHGDIINGSLMAEVPEEKARLSDCLNLPNNFLCIKTTDKVFYINMKAIQQVSHSDH